jgi:hypothetical protein
MNEIAKIYSTSQTGGDLPYFIGKQYGTGWFRNIARLAFPFLKRIGSAFVKTASDVIMKNSDVLPALKEHGISAAKDILPSIANMLSPTNPEKRKKVPRKTINKGKRKRPTIFD